MVIAVAAIPGCSSDDDGTLVQNWTITGGTDPASCERAGAAQMRVVVVDSFGFVEATEFAPCQAFSTALSLSPDTYTATATFLNSSNVAVSRTLLIPGFIISENLTTTVNVPFQLSDFL
jgi:hypothetical protein